MRVSDILRHKGTSVTTIKPSATVEDVIRVLGEHRIGAVVVADGTTAVAGIVSERDIVGHLAAVGRDGLDHAVTSVMTTDVQTCEPADTVEQIMAVMTAGRFRHLPVVVDGALTGIVSIGDAVERRVSGLEAERAQLTDYIQTGR